MGKKLPIIPATGYIPMGILLPFFWSFQCLVRFWGYWSLIFYNIHEIRVYVQHWFLFVCFRFVFWIFIEVQLIYDVVLVSGIKQSQLYIHIDPVFFKKFFSHVGHESTE